MTEASAARLRAMHRVLAYCVGTKKRALHLKPSGKWNGDPEYLFVICGQGDANYATDPDLWRSIIGCAAYLNDTCVCSCSKQQCSVILSTVEAEWVAATSTAQDMLNTMRLMEPMGLKVQKPMILECDNKGAADLANNWSNDGCTRHIEVRQYFLRDLKKDDIILVKWIPAVNMANDIFTKNEERPAFEGHATHFVGPDEYMSQCF